MARDQKHWWLTKVAQRRPGAGRVISRLGRYISPSLEKLYPSAEAEMQQITDIEEFVERLIPYEELVRELAVLRLLGTSYTADDYAAALEEPLGMKIRIKRFEEVRASSGVASVDYDEEAATATIWVPKRLSWWLAQYAIFHELGHLAAGHPYIPVFAETGEEGDPYYPTGRRLARKGPPKYRDLPNRIAKNISPDELGRIHQAEAELRAQHNMLTSQLGEQAIEVDRINQSA